MKPTDQSIRDVSPAELTSCLQWLLQTVRIERAQWILIQLTDRVKRKQLADIFATILSFGHLTEGEEITAAALAVLQPPGAATLLAMGAIGDDESAELTAITAVWRHLVSRLRGSQVRFLQASCDSGTDRLRLQNLGFDHLADLAFLVLDANKFDPSAEVKSSLDYRFEVIGSSPARLNIVCEIAEQSFTETQDCPRLSTFRSAKEVVEGFCLAPTFDPRLWRLLLVDEEPAGCLFLTQHQTRDADLPMRNNDIIGAIEISYMGLVPSHRKRRLGEIVLSEAVRIATQLKAGRMVLAVDRDNLPANSLYRRHGWVEVAQESVWGIRIDT